MKRQNINSVVSRSSIYYPDRSEFYDLDFLVGDDNKGWRAERNLHKSLNHLKLLRLKEKIAEQLGAHSTKSDPVLFERNYAILESHQRGVISTNKAIEQIQKELKEKKIKLKWYRYEVTQLTNGAMAVMLYGDEK